MSAIIEQEKKKMMDSLGYLFYPIVFGTVLWRNNQVLAVDNGLLKAAVLSIFECFVMFGSWLVGIWLGTLPALGCCLVVALFLGVIGAAAKKSPSWRRACISGSMILGVWGLLYALVIGVM